MTTTVRTSLIVAAAAAVLGGCSASSTSLPSAQWLQGATPQVQAKADIYSTHVTLRGPDRRLYTGDAIVFPKNLFPQLRASQLPAVLRDGDVRPQTTTLQYFLWVPGMNGVTSAPEFQDWTEIPSFSIALTVPGPRKGPAAKLTFTKSVDAISPPILADVFSGKLLQGEPPRSRFHPHGSDPEIDVVGSSSGSGFENENVYMYFLFGDQNKFSSTDAVFMSQLTQYAGPSILPSETDEMTSLAYEVCVYPLVNGKPSQNNPVCSK